MAPSEIETVLYKMDGIVQVGVVGVEIDGRADGGKVPRAFVVKGKDSNLTEEDVVAFAAGE